MAGIAVELLVILRLNGGAFSYSLDDPYIHLALADTIAKSGYGLNPGEYSSPSSSVLWPFLLAPFSALRGAALVPLFVNGLLACLSVIPARAVLARCRLPWIGRGGPLAESAVLIAFLLSINVLGLVFTGMEHSFQVLLALVAADGVTRCAEQSPVRWPVWMALLLGPLIRYENLAITLPCCVYLGLNGYRRQASLVALGAIAALGGFSAFLVSLGLGPVPNSIVAKTARYAGDYGPGIVGFLHRSAAGVVMNFNEHPAAVGGMVGLLAGVVLACPRPSRGLVATGAAAVAVHTLWGSYGWFGRYHAYLAGYLLLVGLYATRSIWTDPEPWLSRAAMAIGLLLFVALDRELLEPVVLTPAASNNIYCQQYQMHRFLSAFFPHNACCNDVGWVSYRSGVFIVDLWGLGSAEALRARLHHFPPAWMADLARRHDAKVAMLYRSWIPATPTGWVEVARLTVLSPCVTLGESTVSFYSCDPSSTGQLVQALVAFSATLPLGVTLKLLEAPSRPSLPHAAAGRMQPLQPVAQEPLPSRARPVCRLSSNEAPRKKRESDATDEAPRLLRLAM